jgi:hypothetical protein
LGMMDRREWKCYNDVFCYYFNSLKRPVYGG